MSDTILIGKRLVPMAEIALVEPFDPATNPRLQSTRPFKSRLIMRDRESILAELEPEAFTERHGFRLIPLEAVALNPAGRFSVETFAPGEGFAPAKPFRSRIVWRDLDGNNQSKLLVSEPDAVLEVITGSASQAASSVQSPSHAKPKRRRAARQVEPQPV